MIHAIVIVFGLHHKCIAPLVFRKVSSGSGQLLQSMTACSCRVTHCQIVKQKFCPFLEEWGGAKFNHFSVSPI